MERTVDNDSTLRVWKTPVLPITPRPLSYYYSDVKEPQKANGPESFDPGPFESFSLVGRDYGAPRVIAIVSAPALVFFP